MSQTVARLLNSFSADGQRFHTTKAASDVEFQDPGYLSLYCFNGLHMYLNGKCVHCDRKQPGVNSAKGDH